MAKSILEKLLQYEAIWRLIKPFSRLGIRLNDLRKSFESAPIEKQLPGPVPFDSLMVQSGPFKGMMYPTMNVGRTIYAKLLGSYELEIQSYIYNLVNENYNQMIDVGCAEGYYTVGFALKCKPVKIYAYDLDSEVRQICREMARLNGVEHKITLEAEMTPQKLKEFEFTGKNLIICDCEGYEKVLFNTENIENLKRCDLIIETHDFIDIEISTYLKQLFKSTHEIISVYSNDDIQKALTYNIEALSSLSLDKRKTLLEERRPAIMEWLILKAKADGQL